MTNISHVFFHTREAMKSAKRTEKVTPVSARMWAPETDTQTHFRHQ